MVQVKIKLSDGIMPKKGSKYAAAYDLYVPRDVELKAGRQIIDLGFSMELPHGYAAIIQPRSGFASKGMEVESILSVGDSNYREITRVDADVLLGLVDEDYRGNVGAIVKYVPAVCAKMILKKGTRIGQMRIVEVPETEFIQVEELDMTNDRGGGFGHTGA